MKIVINKCYGSFGLSPKAMKRLAELQGKECYFFALKSPRTLDKQISVEETSQGLWIAYSVPNPKSSDICLDNYINCTDRSDPLLVKVVEELGKEANGRFADLKVVEIPDGIEWEISEHCGAETVEEVHRFWS